MDDVGRFQDELPTGGQVLNNNAKKDKTTTENRFANPISEVEIQAMIDNAVPKSYLSIKKNGLLTCSRTGNSK